MNWLGARRESGASNLIVRWPETPSAITPQSDRALHVMLAAEAVLLVGSANSTLYPDRRFWLTGDSQW